MPVKGKKSFWEQFPLVVGALTALLAAITGAIVAYRALVSPQPAGNSAAPQTLPGNASTGVEEPGSPPSRPSASIQVADGANTVPAVRQPAEPAPSTPAPQPVRSGCDRVGDLQSPGTNQEVRFTFINRSDHPIWLEWIDHRGTRVRVPASGGTYGQLAQGAHYTQITYSSHLWVIADQQAECRRVVTVPDTDSVYEYR